MSDVLRWQPVVTRKPCKCPLCRREIPIKSKMIVAAWADGGRVFSEKFCTVCEEYWRCVISGEEITFDEYIYGDDFESRDLIRKQQEQKP